MEVRKDDRIVVVGLGYVGLPLAIALARHFEVVGLDIDAGRVDELRRGHDRTNEVEEADLASTSLQLSAEPDDCRGADVYIVTVPTPVDSDNRPDLRAVESACRTVGKLLSAEQRPVVVFESTVYPGVTEDVCGPLLEQVSGLRSGHDFFLGYSPERINPGDREHTVDRIVKVVAGQDEATTDRLARFYGAVTSAGVFRAASIKAAEAAKVIENAQRDINIAFMNEITQIFAKLDLSIWDVLDAAGTKWNFLRFQPGLVGGHCIGVDPYYLSHRAQQLGHAPNVILSGRSINDGMAHWVADSLHEAVGRKAGSVVILGLTFKEDVPDLRNSKVVDLVRRLESLGHKVTIHDPRADPADARHEYGIELDSDALDRRYDLVVAAVPHAEYRGMTAAEIEALAAPGSCVADLKGVWRRHDLGEGIRRWSL
jgi:UDP-N-acetyl-D-glucosamine/UDP-N-acetyl-D-galactosamine dehydrogenase